MGSLTETLGTLFAAYGSKLGQAIVEHTIYVLISVAIGFALGLLLGIVFSRFPRCSSVILPILSIFQTIPGLVFIGVLYIWWGNSYSTVIVALSVYAMFPVLKNTYTGILGVERKFLEAAGLRHVPAPDSAAGGTAPGYAHHHCRSPDGRHLYGLLDRAGRHDRQGRPGRVVYRVPRPTTAPSFCWARFRPPILAVIFGAVIDLLQKKVTPRGLRKEAGK